MDTSVQGSVPGGMEPKPLWRPYVFDQKGPLLMVNTGSSPVEGGLILAADFTEG